MNRMEQNSQIDTESTYNCLLMLNCIFLIPVSFPPDDNYDIMDLKHD